jgi:hypothetical protein
LKITSHTKVETADPALKFAPVCRWTLHDKAVQRRLALRYAPGMNMRVSKEQTVCEWQGVSPEPPKKKTKLGIALGTLGKTPINGLRHQPENGTNGWYIWCGSELPQDSDAFSPLHVEHIGEYFPETEEYLSLPPGFRFLIDGSNYEDVWFDESLLNSE